MNEKDAEGRSFVPLGTQHLERLYRLVSDARSLYTVNRPDLKGRIIAGCLAQGAAAHYVDGTTGVKDIDIWLFFNGQHLDKGMPNRTVRNLDFGPSDLGRHPDDDPSIFSGRRVDVMARAVIDELGNPEVAVRSWLRGHTKSARLLRQRPVIMVWPKAYVGRVINW